MTNPTLKCKKETRIVVNECELDEFIEEVYGVNYEPTAREEWSNDTEHCFILKKKLLDDYDTKKIRALESGKPEDYSLRVIMTDLCNKNLIEEGTYTISVSW